MLSRVCILALIAGIHAQNFTMDGQSIAHPVHGDSQRIVNGQEAPKDKYPWIVALEARVKGDESSYSCGGTLIAPGYVLTAAHCYYPKRSANFGTVYYGKHSSCFTGFCDDGVDIAEVIIHPQYNSGTMQHDIAILKLATPITTITPVGLAEAGYTANQNFGNDGKAISLGWGVDNVITESMPSTLQLGNVNLINRKKCGSQFRYGSSDIISGMVCANSPSNTDSCQGDSGGPLFVPSRGVQVGVVSWGIGCGSDDYPGVYTDVGTYYNWVEGITGDLVPPQPTAAPPPTPAPAVVTCECKAAWEWDGINYSGCEETPDDAAGAWCYTVAECTGSKPSGSTAGANWAYCDNDATPVTDAPVTTDAPTTKPPTTKPPVAPPTVAPTIAPTTDAPVTDSPAVGGICVCKAAWEFDGAAYFGCTTTPDDETAAWCYTTLDCEDATESELNPGTFWTLCDPMDGPTESPPTTVAPSTVAPTTATDAPTTVAPTTVAPTTPSTSAPLASTSTAAPPASVCGAGSYAMLMDNGSCPVDTHELVESADDCEMAATEVFDNSQSLKFKVIKNKKNPKGCFSKGNRLYFNEKGKTTSKNTKKKAICCTIPTTSYYSSYDYYEAYGTDDTSNTCKCKSTWQFDGESYKQCAFTPDDLENSWCYTDSECDGSSMSESYSGKSWAFCNIKDNKRASFGGAVQHKSKAAAVAGGADSSSSPGGGSAGAGASGVGTAAAGIVAALLVVGALVVVVVNKRRTRGRRDADDVHTTEASGVADQLEDGGIAIPEEAAVDGLERADSYHDAQTAVAYNTANPSDFAAAQFVLDAAAQGSLKIKSVRRPNPAYRSSAFIETADSEGI